MSGADPIETSSGDSRRADEPPAAVDASARPPGRETNMTPQEKAESLGITFTKQEPGYLALVVRTGDLLITSGHVSDIKGKLGAGLTVDEGKAAARECAVKILNSVWN